MRDPINKLYNCGNNNNNNSNYSCKKIYNKSNSKIYKYFELIFFFVKHKIYLQLNFTFYCIKILLLNYLLLQT